MAEWMVATDANAVAGLGEFLARSVPGQWVEVVEGALVVYHLQRANDEESSIWPMARALAQYLVIYQERAWLLTLFRRRYSSFSTAEENEILDETLRILHSDDEHDVDRIDLTTTLLFSYLTEEHRVVLDGVRDFLLPDIRAEFEDAMDRAVDVFLMEQEYREFVRLLRQLVEVAGTGTEAIHVRFSGHHFFFEDNQGRRLGDKLVEEMLSGLDFEDGHADDVLISALVTLAPRHVTIHQGGVGDEAFRTVTAVFEGRVSFCQGCRRCHQAQIDRDRRSF